LVERARRGEGAKRLKEEVQMIQFLYFSLMQQIENMGPKFLNSDHALETGLVTSVKEGWNFVA
jgi:hypothetical protein